MENVMMILSQMQNDIQSLQCDSHVMKEMIRKNSNSVNVSIRLLAGSLNISRTKLVDILTEAEANLKTVKSGDVFDLDMNPMHLHQPQRSENGCSCSHQQNFMMEMYKMMMSMFNPRKPCCPMDPIDIPLATSHAQAPHISPIPVSQHNNNTEHCADVTDAPNLKNPQTPCNNTNDNTNGIDNDTTSNDTISVDTISNGTSIVDTISNGTSIVGNTSTSVDINSVNNNSNLRPILQDALEAKIRYKEKEELRRKYSNKYRYMDKVQLNKPKPLVQEQNIVENNDLTDEQKAVYKISNFYTISKLKERKRHLTIEPRIILSKLEDFRTATPTETSNSILLDNEYSRRSIAKTAANLQETTRKKPKK
ncbi:actin-related protein 8-like [Adelges cooleyi]|uniref:actin-related protein 8-like n=1 Tax=Adelges cooleyi TaxID=133065 RepID=UPI00217FD55C|nr:actin-related protein 8-like [Adelges cooleyi]